jgi:hypothetical protein
MSMYFSEGELGQGPEAKMSNTESTLMQLFAETDELEIFESESVQQMI